MIHGRFFLLAICFFLSSALGITVAGCDDDDSAIVWSSHVVSPDGAWIATAQTRQYSGPGTAGIETTVYLARAGDPASEPNTRIEVLSYPQERLSLRPENDLKVRWVNSSHLEISYKGPREIDFEAIKCAGIEIGVSEMPR